MLWEWTPIQMWIAYQCVVEENRRIERMREEAGEAGPARAKREELSDVQFFARTGIRPQQYPNLKSERLKREAMEGN